MNKLFLSMTACLWLAAAGLALAQDGTGSTYNPPESREKDSRNQKGPTHRHVHSSFPLKANPKNQGKDKPQTRFFPLTPSPKPNDAPAPEKNPLLDQKGKPVTFWPAGQKKNYTTLFQDKQN